MLEKKIKSERNILNFLPNELKSSNISNYKANPPYINQCIYNSSRDEIYFGLLNGVLVNLKNNLKTNYVRLVHNTMMKDMKVYNKENNDSLITLGKDKCIKYFDLEEGKIKLSVDLSDFSSEDPSLIESDITGSIYYTNSNCENINIIKFK